MAGGGGQWQIIALYSQTIRSTVTDRRQSLDRLTRRFLRAALGVLQKKMPDKNSRIGV